MASQPNVTLTPFRDWSWLIRPAGGLGRLFIRDDLWHVTEWDGHDPAANRVRVVLARPGVTVTVATVRDRVYCSCPAGGNPGVPCDHAAAVKAAYGVKLVVNDEAGREPCGFGRRSWRLA